MPPQTRGWNLFFKVPPQTRDRDLSFTARPTDTPVPSTMESDNLMKLNIDKKKKYFLLGTGILWVALAAFLSGKSPLPTQAVPLSQVSPPGGLCGTFNPYSSLSVPTQITRIGDDYFLVDCYHNQILTSTSPETPLSEWQVMTDLINRGHTIAGDGTVCLADDTENNRILVFQKIKGRYFLSQVLENIGLRPHYVCYDQEEERFLALSSMTGELYVFRRSPDSCAVALEKILSIPELEGVYVRSFTLDGDDIYFPACNGTILRTGKEDLTVLERFAVPEQYAGMVQVSRIQDKYYITVSTDLWGDPSHATILQAEDLSRLDRARDISSCFGGAGTPYYISSFDGSYFLTKHCDDIGVFSFIPVEEGPEQVHALHP